ncbi:MAG: substrate-binding domain-containing protein [Bacteroidales bacterium]|nr:substrate-binding domain-containing protein [Bacteroidales bacterium]
MSKNVRAQQKRVTIKDIAALSHVSIGTVDRVLHNRGEVNQETHERVMSFVEELGYTPNLLAKSLALKKSFTIAALIPETGPGNPYWAMPLAGLTKAVEELNDFNTRISVFHFDQGDETSFIRQFDKVLDIHPHGIIMAPTFHETAMRYLSKCEELNIPLILIDNNLDAGKRLGYFGQDAQQSGYVAAKLMHYGLPGCSTVLILNLAQNKVITRHMNRREQGFRDYFQKIVPGNCIQAVSVEIDLIRQDEPERSLKEVFGRYPDIAGIFVTNSRVHKVARYFTHHKKGGILLVGYDLIHANLEFVENGIVDFLICQKPEDQGYKSAMAMFNYLLTGKPVEKVNYSPIDIIIKENSGYYKNINNSYHA